MRIRRNTLGGSGRRSDVRRRWRRGLGLRRWFGRFCRLGLSRWHNRDDVMLELEGRSYEEIAARLEATDGAQPSAGQPG